jgi:hypothetical protein
MCTTTSTHPAGGAPAYYVSWLGPSAPRIAATYGAAPLPLLVEAVLSELTAAGRSFTPYDVTLVLRALLPYPRRELPHYDQHGIAGVQPEVHAGMARYLAHGAYTTRVVRRNGLDDATLYIPAGLRRSLLSLLHKRTTPPAVPTLPSHAWVVRND